MTDTQLKMLLDALAGMGAEGKTAFIWWLVADKVVPAVAWLMFAVVIALTVRFALVKVFPPPKQEDQSLSFAQQAYEAARKAWLHGPDSGCGDVPGHQFYEAAKAYARTKGLKL